MKLTNRFQERYQKTKHLHAGKAVSFRIDQVRIPENQLAEREYLVHPGAVGVLPFASPKEIILVKQYRYPIRQFTYEIPAGKLGRGENPLACVGRELEEETGYRARKIKKLVSYWPTAAFSTEIIHLYLAEGLVQTEPHPDADEFIEIVRASPKTVEKWIKTGQIQDSKTLIAYLAWKTL